MDGEKLSHLGGIVLKPENIKQIEGVRDKYPLNHEVARAIEDLLIERNCVILPAFYDTAATLMDEKGDAGWSDEKQVKELMNKQMSRQWETFM